MPKHRKPSSRRPLRSGVTALVLATAGIAVPASSAVANSSSGTSSDVAAVPAPQAIAPAVATAALPPLPSLPALPAPPPLSFHPALPQLPIQPPPPELPLQPALPPVYPDNLDGWIRHALDVMHSNNIPGSYDGIHRNVMRESSGNPRAINLWDSNAAAGHPSKGLLQLIEPTFDAYHVAGTPSDIWDPVANITAACNYAAHRYGSMDNVHSAY